MYLDLHGPILDAVKSPLRPQQPTRVLQAQGPHLGSDHLAAALVLGTNCGLVGVHPVFSPKMPPAYSEIKAHHCEGLAGIGFGSGIHDPGNWAIWVYVLITK